MVRAYKINNKLHMQTRDIDQLTAALAQDNFDSTNLSVELTKIATSYTNVLSGTPSIKGKEKIDQEEENILKFLRFVINLRNNAVVRGLGLDDGQGDAVPQFELQVKSQLAVRYPDITEKTKLDALLRKELCKSKPDPLLIYFLILEGANVTGLKGMDIIDRMPRLPPLLKKLLTSHGAYDSKDINPQNTTMYPALDKVTLLRTLIKNDTITKESFEKIINSEGFDFRAMDSYGKNIFYYLSELASLRRGTVYKLVRSLEDQAQDALRMEEYQQFKNDLYNKYPESKNFDNSRILCELIENQNSFSLNNWLNLNPKPKLDIDYQDIGGDTLMHKAFRAYGSPHSEAMSKVMIKLISHLATEYPDKDWLTKKNNKDFTPVELLYSTDKDLSSIVSIFSDQLDILKNAGFKKNEGIWIKVDKEQEQKNRTQNADKILLLSVIAIPVIAMALLSVKTVNDYVLPPLFNRTLPTPSIKIILCCSFTIPLAVACITNNFDSIKEMFFNSKVANEQHRAPLKDKEID